MVTWLPVGLPLAMVAQMNNKKVLSSVQSAPWCLVQAHLGQTHPLNCHVFFIITSVRLIHISLVITWSVRATAAAVECLSTARTPCRSDSGMRLRRRCHPTPLQTAHGGASGSPSAAPAHHVALLMRGVSRSSTPLAQVDPFTGVVKVKVPRRYGHVNSD